ncbi:AIR synthase family protein [Candidatus Bathyarchaeota archaeon]|nr:AIR synthase family protein [Candidatus Bathyarchaeota archaeon]MBS7630487.1 AIR synthase family protein [Candidatus Bathyarchaeota archaeon]
MPSIRRFPTGKIPPNWLKEIVFKRLGLPSDRLLLGPKLGEDAAIIDMGHKVLAVKADPITGAVTNIGRLVVHINANDIASCGVRPLWFICVVMLPEGSDEDMLKKIMSDVDEALREVGASLISGHTETTPALERPILVGCMIGEASKDCYLATSGAREGDVLIMTKTAGIEGTAILASDLYDHLKGVVDGRYLENAKSFLDRISVVPEAMIAMDVGGVHSMHDPTEGGVLNGVWEMAEAADKGVFIDEQKIPIADETKLICRKLRIDPLKLLGSGALLIASDPEKAPKICQALKEASIDASIIGWIKPRAEGRYMLLKNGGKRRIVAIKQDHLYKTFDEYGIK